MKILSCYKIGKNNAYSIRLKSDFIGNTIKTKYGIFNVLGIEKHAINRPLQKDDVVGIMLLENLKEDDEIEWIL